MTRRSAPEGFVEDSWEGAEFGKADSWYQLVGPLFKATHDEPGSVRMGFFSEPRYISSMGRVHGGMMASFMDYLLFSAAFKAWGEVPLATVSLNINYVSACPADVWVEGHGRVVHAGSNMAFISGEAMNGSRVIVQASGTFRKLAT